MSFESMLNQKCDVYTKTETDDATGGGWTEGLVLSESNQRCRLKTAGVQERDLQGREGTISSHIIYKKISTIDSNTIIKITSTTKGVRTFEVNYVQNWAEDDKYLKIYVTEKV